MKTKVKETAEMLNVLPDDVIQIVYDMAVMLVERWAPEDYKRFFPEEQKNDLYFNGREPKCMAWVFCLK